MSNRLVPLFITSVLVVSAKDKFTPHVDEILKEWSKADSPGAAVAVIQQGKVAFQKGYGIANLEYGIPITSDTVFHVASVSKQFTAMALVLLEQDRKLSLEDDIRKYLTELPNYGNVVTIRNLLQHTGGIRDQWQTLALAGWRLDDVITQKQILGIMFRQKELNFPPGTEFLYSNGGYTLAAEIVARVSGKRFPHFCDERIFKPLGMMHTHFHDDHKRIVKDRAYSYSKSGSGYEAAPLNYANAGATSLFTTAINLARWLDNFRDPKVGGRAAIDRLQEQRVLSSGKKIDYALGVSIGTQRRLKTVSHSGGDAGYRSHVVWFPEEQLGVAVLSNAGNFNAGEIANNIAAAFLGNKMGPDAEAPKPPSQGGGSGDGEQMRLGPFNAADLPQYAGVYWSDELETQYTMVIREGKLVANHVRHGEITLTPSAKDQFTGGQWFMQKVNFVRDDSGRVTGVTMGGGRIKGIRFEKRR